MTFKDGLLKARGQITFVLALAISTGIIIYLEALDTEQRIQARVAAELAQRNAASASAPPALQAAVRSALRRSEEVYAREPRADEARAGLLTSFAAAVQLGVMEPGDGLSQVQKILDEMEQNRGELSASLISALGLAAATFPSLQDRIARLSPAS
ncbi:hypothetical protein ACFOYU_01770 [Microvirga sp. GCM10011540]|uniref:hypothetical protein n=1 Tax=Microvirga sp. GCM10011540 TaxID=3317338 RepID=UPI00360C5B60